MRRAERISIFLALRRACHSQPVVAVFVPGVKGMTSADDSGDESPCNAVGTLEITCDSVDCTPLVVEVPAPWATAPGLAVSGGALSAGIVDADAEAPA